ncbi:uncharacterized protein TNCV_813691 [Trichonephila clavipes]|nr:uncharacterized protein TNCV_813691 [Trichonephila clavipes]
MKSAELKTLFEEAKSGSSKESRYIVENNLLFFQKEDKDGTKRKCLVVPEKYRKNLLKIGHEAAATHLGVTKTKKMSYSRHLIVLNTLVVLRTL